VDPLLGAEYTSSGPDPAPGEDAASCACSPVGGRLETHGELASAPFSFALCIAFCPVPRASLQLLESISTATASASLQLLELRCFISHRRRLCPVPVVRVAVARGVVLPYTAGKHAAACSRVERTVEHDAALRHVARGVVLPD
jgi:hypothetical protein